jgi:hypothetical protein
MTAHPAESTHTDAATRKRDPATVRLRLYATCRRRINALIG